MASGDTPGRFLRVEEAARFLGLSARTLEKHRTYGTGPVYRKLGGRIVYTVEDLVAWANRGTRNSTSDPGRDTILPARRKDEQTPPRGSRRGRRRKPPDSPADRGETPR